MVFVTIQYTVCKNEIPNMLLIFPRFAAILVSFTPPPLVKRRSKETFLQNRVKLQAMQLTCSRENLKSKHEDHETKIFH